MKKLLLAAVLLAAPLSAMNPPPKTEIKIEEVNEINASAGIIIKARDERRTNKTLTVATSKAVSSILTKLSPLIEKAAVAYAARNNSQFYAHLASVRALKKDACDRLGNCVDPVPTP